MKTYTIDYDPFVAYESSADFRLARILRDEFGPRNHRLVLEGYLNDIYKLFLRKVSEFEYRPLSEEDDIVRLRSLLEEVIKVKKLLADPVDKK